VRDLRTALLPVSAHLGPGLTFSLGTNYHQPPSWLFYVGGGVKGKKNNYLIEVL